MTATRRTAPGSAPLRLVAPAARTAPAALRLVTALAALAAPLAAQASPTTDAFVSSGIVETQGDHVLALRDVDGDGDLDLVVVDELGVSLRRLGADGRYPRQPDDLLPWPTRDLGWELADLDGAPGTELVIFADGELRSWPMGADGFGEPSLLLTDPGARLPRGVRPLRLARDVDADGRLDAVLPGVGQYRIHRAGAEGFREPLLVDYEAATDYRGGDPRVPHGRFEQSLRIPRLRVRDFDGDGRNDLVSETDEILAVHVADPDIPTEPTWRLDLELLRDELEQEIDFDNLIGSFPLVSWQSGDLDRRGAHDFVLQQGGTFRVWLDGTRKGIDGPPDQVLKSSGNVLLFLLRDVLGDARPELQIIRVEEISVARLVQWFVVPGALDFDVYTYANETGANETGASDDAARGVFGRKPARRSRVRFEIPRLLAFAEELEEIEDETREKAGVQAQRVALDPDGLRNDVVDLVDGELLFFHDVVDADAEAGLLEQLGSFEFEELLERFFLADLDAMDDGGTRTFDLAKELRELELTPAWSLQQATSAAGATPSLVLPSPVPGEGRLLALDLDADGLSDLIVTGEAGDGTPLVGVLVARPGHAGR